MPMVILIVLWSATLAKKKGKDVPGKSKAKPKAPPPAAAPTISTYQPVHSTEQEDVFMNSILGDMDTAPVTPIASKKNCVNGTMILTCLLISTHTVVEPLTKNPWTLPLRTCNISRVMITWVQRRNLGLVMLVEWCLLLSILLTWMSTVVLTALTTLPLIIWIWMLSWTSMTTIWIQNQTSSPHLRRNPQNCFHHQHPRKKNLMPNSHGSQSMTLLQSSVKTCWAPLALAHLQTALQPYPLLKKMALSISFGLITLSMTESCILWASSRTGWQENGYHAV